MQFFGSGLRQLGARALAAFDFAGEHGDDAVFPMRTRAETLTARPPPPPRALPSSLAPWRNGWIVLLVSEAN